MTEDEKTLNEHQLDLNILKSIAACGDYLAPKVAVIQATQMRHAPRPLTSEVERRLNDLDARGMINPVRGAGGLKFALTERGRAFLQEHG